MTSVPPGLILILGAFLLPMTRGAVRNGVLLVLPVIALALVWRVPDGPALAVPFLDDTVILVQGTTLGRLFATVFLIMAFTGGLFAMQQKRLTELVAGYVYAGSAVSVTMVGDLLSVLVFWELMAIASGIVIWSAGTAESYRASMRYVAIHLLGGVVLMVGIVGHFLDTGSLAFTAMVLDSPATWLILAGFLVNAGAPPLSAWLPDAYPEASYSGMVFLSAFTTKTAVYVLLVGFPGTELLIYFGLYMIFYGIIYALLENDMRRILAYSIVNQVGFMVAGIGIGTPMALNGAASHAFAHIIYKALLLMAAGSVFYMTGKRKCTELGGLFHSMPLTATFGIIGALSISAFPLTSGFTTKSMISQAAFDQNLSFAWFLLIAASAGVFLHAGIKFPWFVFFQKDSGLRPPEPPLNMRLAMLFFAVLCIGLGVFPGPLYALLPFPVEFVPYTVPHVMNMLQLLLFSGLAFFVLLPLMKRTETLSLDFDWLYRRLLPAVADGAMRVGGRLRAGVLDFAARRLQAFIATVYSRHGPQGVMARTWQTGSAALLVATALSVLLLLFLFWSPSPQPSPARGEGATGFSPHPFAGEGGARRAAMGG